MMLQRHTSACETAYSQQETQPGACAWVFVWLADTYAKVSLHAQQQQVMSSSVSHRHR